jgi:hypothetical protein
VVVNSTTYRAHVGNYNRDTALVIDGETNTVVAASPWAIALGPCG